MSGFSPDWLALREPADLTARDPAILARLEEAFTGEDRCRVCDLGAGTGASIRAFAGLLPDEQHWTLLDNDTRNLVAARSALAAWADEHEASDSGQRLRRAEKNMEVSFSVADLSVLGTGAPPWAEGGADLVTASALLDLTSADWMAALAEAVAGSRAAVLATLNFDGALEFTPAHRADAAVRQAFCDHQRRDKGFGPATGPDATRLFAAALEARGYRVEMAASPWRLGPSDAILISNVIQGIADAVAETDALLPGRLCDWRDARLAGLESLLVGHQDLIAVPR